MRFPRQLIHASFSRVLSILVNRVQLALRDAIQFLMIFSKYSTRVTVLLDISPVFNILVDTDSKNRNFSNDPTF